jgi:ADP-heptose:LPS heptosyltransferase
LCKKYCADLINSCPDADEVITIESFGSNHSLSSFLKTQNIDLSISVFPEFRTALSFYNSGIKYRIGTAYRWYSFLFNMKVREHRKESMKHESEYNFNLLKTFFNEAEYILDVRLNTDKNIERKVSELLKEFSGNQDVKYIIIHPGSRGSSADWKLDNFKILTENLLKENPNVVIILTGTGNESELTEFIKKNTNESFRNRIYDLSNKLNLKELIALIKMSDLFISNSTGPIHIAGLMNKKILGFYPFVKPMNPKRWAPLSENKIILNSESSNTEDALKSAIDLLS